MLGSLGGQPRRGVNIMGDRSPKSVQKQANQKQAKTNKSNNKKQAAANAKVAASSVKKK